MQGLEIARTFFFDWGLPWLQAELPALVNRVAAGRLSGSDVLGGDDAISRDHNWGPQFHLFLTAADFASHGKSLQQRINAAAPRSWKGWKVAGGGDQNVLVESVPGFFQRVFGLAALPPRSADWDRMEESHLYFLRHGAVWHDPLGELTAVRTLLAHYPPAVRRRRLQQECFRTWHFGEYNFVQRMVKRNDPVAVTICLGEFMQAVMRLFLLVEGDYTPYWKWLAFEFRKQPAAAAIDGLLTRLAQSTDRSEQATIVRQVCAQMHARLLEKKLITGAGANQWLLPLLNAANELAQAEGVAGQGSGG